MIYILDNYPKLTAQYLDDKSLDKQIKDIAQVLVNVHKIVDMDKCINNHKNDRPCGCFNNMQHFYSKSHTCDKHKLFVTKLTKTANRTLIPWNRCASECKANYLYLVELGWNCLTEHYHRHGVLQGRRPRQVLHKMHHVIEWAKANVPDLPKLKGVDKSLEVCQLPLIMPKKYLVEWSNNCDANYLLRDYHTESYRNYYQAKLQQKQCKQCEGTWKSINGIDCKSNTRWTKRSKPSWLSL